MVTDTRDPKFIQADPPRAFPLVSVSDLTAVRAFYVDRLGCPATFDLPTYLQVQLTPFGDRGPELCFMVDEAGDGATGVILSVPVANADEVQARFEAADVPIALPVEDKPWGWRSFHAVDPAGLVLDLFHVIEK